ncbi:MAG: TraX family protein [Lachnospirales bacterium]
MSGIVLKLIAILTMAIDHIGLVNDLFYFRVIGRIAFFLFAFMIAEGVVYTRDIKKYLMRLLLFAFISDPFFDIFFYTSSGNPFELSQKAFFDLSHQNVMFTLFFGALACVLVEKLWNSEDKKEKVVLSIGIVVTFAISMVSNQDYGMVGTAMVLFFYMARNSFNAQAIVVITFAIILYYFNAELLLGAVSSLIFIKLYNGNKGTFGNKTVDFAFQLFTYIFYPLHLLLLSI